MGLNDYTVGKDSFEFDEARFDFFFPCCACKNRYGTDFEEPCRTCGHNTRCVSDEVTPNPWKADIDAQTDPASAGDPGLF